MKFIIGLGNPGRKYQDTRHNAGHWAIDTLTPKVKSKVSNVKLIKTSTFMNESGKEVKQLTVKHKLLTHDLLIGHDDLDLEPGAWKIQFNRSAAGHKGVQSIIDELGTQEFWRFRIGIGRPTKKADEYVLEDPSKEDRGLVEEAIADALPRVLEWGRAL